jgi:hypothetical protein
MPTKAKRRRPKNKASATQHTVDPQLRPDAAGIDVGAEEMVAAVPPGRDPQGCVRTFKTFTTGLLALRDWLLARGITTAALESTGNYWITAYDLLEAAGIEVFLVNARHVKVCPAKRPTCATPNGCNNSTPPACSKNPSAPPRRSSRYAT